MPTKDDDGFLMPSQTTDSEEFERETDWFRYFYIYLTIALALASAKMTYEGMLVAVVPGGSISQDTALALTLVGSALIVFCALAGEKYIKTKGMKATILDIFVYFSHSPSSHAFEFSGSPSSLRSLISSFSHMCATKCGIASCQFS